MARRMSVARHGGHAGKHLALPEQPRPALVGRDLFTAGHEIELCRSLIDLCHRAIVEPVRQLVLVHHEFRVRKQKLAVRHVGQSGGMIRMHVGQQHRIDRLRIDAGQSEVALNEAGRGLQVVARSGVDDRGAPLRMDQEGVDTGSPCRPERVRQELARLLDIDIAHHLEGAVEIAVADGGDDDVPDPAVIDAGYLRCWLRLHMEIDPWRTVGGMVRFCQAPTDLRNSSMQSESRSGVCTDI